MPDIQPQPAPDKPDTPARPLLVTHGGRFHCDEVVAYVVIRCALDLLAPGRDHILTRTRDPGVIAAGDIVWDVGTIHDPASNRFDHHQRGAPVRADGTPFSSAGLVWRIYGERAVACLLGRDDALGFAPAIAAELDETIIRRIDEADNGIAREEDVIGLSALVGDFNPPWDEPQNDDQLDRAFHEAVAFVEIMLRRRIGLARARHVAEAHVLAAHAASEDPRILLLERGMPWKAVAFAHRLPVLYCVSPASNGNWTVDSMPPDPGSFAQRLPLPAAWAGLQDDELAAASGVPDAVFVHLRRFMGAARTREGALALAERSILGAGLGKSR